MGKFTTTSAANSKPTIRESVRIFSNSLTTGSRSRCFTDTELTDGLADPQNTIDPVYEHPLQPSAMIVAKQCSSVQVTWLGHASTYMLFPTADPGRPFGVLTDPIFSKSCSPIGWPRRRVNVPFQTDELGPVDAVIISHNHCKHVRVCRFYWHRRVLI